MGSEPTDLILSSATRKYWVPYADKPEYKARLLHILNTEKPDLIHFQNDLEIFHGSMLREDIHATGTKTFMPAHDVIDTCVHKYKCWEKFRDAGITVPKNMMIHTPEDLKRAFDELGDKNGKIWLRASSIGGGGKGALPTADYNFAKGWIDHYAGWGDFAAAEILTPQSVTWLSIWYEGELVVAQGRIRKGWTHGSRTLSGVTGVTKVGRTEANSEVDEIATACVRAVDAKPHGICGVDMTYDTKGVPNPTEINISRFFTTVLFFTEAGLNMPQIFADLGIHGRQPKLDKKLNPLPDGLLWMRAMDRSPLLARDKDVQKGILFD